MEAPEAAGAADRARAAADRRRARAALLEGACLDELTGVYRRGPGQLALDHEVDRARRTGEPLVLAFVDVDGLKQVNDRDGHAAGDALLRGGGRDQGSLRPCDPVVRVGGSEFVCALTNTAPEPAGRWARELRAALRQSWPTASIGVGLAQLLPNETVEEPTARADSEPYRAKGAR